LIDIRHCCRNRNRIAEISVPAWPMPIHHTKLMMSKPQPTGWLTPQTPMPLKSSITTAISRPCSSAKPTAKPKNQLSGVFSLRTMSLIFSVTVFSVCPGAMTGVSGVSPTRW
jgi:hypothetical protein